MQVGKHYFGAHVTGVTTTQNIELVRSLGADEVIDFTKEDFTKRGETYDVILDAVGKHSFFRSKRALRTPGLFLPTDRLGWSPGAGEFTCGEIVRHLTAAEQMFVGAVVEGRWRYAGHTHDPAHELDGLLADLEAGHHAAMDALRALDDTALAEPRPTLNGPTVKAWRLLMAARVSVLPRVTAMTVASPEASETVARTPSRVRVYSGIRVTPPLQASYR